MAVHLHNETKHKNTTKAQTKRKFDMAVRTEH